MFEYISLVLSNKLVKMRIKNANAKKFKKTHIGRGGPKISGRKKILVDSMFETVQEQITPDLSD